MNTTQSTRKRAMQFFAVMLLTVLHIGGPALAFVSAGTTAAPCQADGQECCCVTEVEVIESSCCSSRSDDEQGPTNPSEEDCDCRVGSGELPEQAPAVLLGVSEVSLSTWIRDCALQSATTVRGVDSIGTLMEVGTGTEHVPRLARADLARQVSSVGAWKLLTRGVAGFLAILAVARV